MKQRRANTRASGVAMAESRPARSERILRFLERRSLALAVILIVIASARIIATYNVFSNTADEAGHIAAGMEWLDKGVYRWEPQHPPLSRVAGALGPFLLGVRCQGTPKQNGFSLHMEGIGILYHEGKFDRNIAAARLGMLPFFWVACLAVYWWGKYQGGPAAGVLALFLFSFVPPVLAHAGVTTTDMALTAFLGASFISGLLWLERPGAARAAVFGVSTGLMVLAKFSCLAFFPAVVGLAAVWYFLSERPAPRWLLSQAMARIPTLLLAVLVACVTIWAGYRFSFGELGNSGWRLPAPELWGGILDVKAHNQGGHSAYLLGERSDSGWWYFFEVALAVKTPLAFLALAGLGLPLAFGKQTRFRRAWIPAAFAAGILVVGAVANINIGVRHVLPVYLGLSVVAGLAALRLMESARTRQFAGIAAAVLVTWLAGSSLLSHPDYLAYFNALGGSEPEKILADSDLDWGQDLKRLAARMREVGARELHYTSIFPTDFRYNGLPRTLDTNAQVPSPGWNAVGVTQWKITRMQLWNTHPEVVLWPDRFPPTERVGKSILLWYFPYPQGGRR